MRAREYLIVVEAEGGHPARELCRTATTGHPAAGDELVLDQVTYVVTRVRHEDDLEAPSDDRVYTIARVYVRPLGGGGGRRSRTPTAGGAARVLELRVPTSRAGAPIASVILPATLVALLVAVGYREQASRHRTGRRVAARLRREGHGWIVEGGDDQRALSRRAKRHFAEAVALITGAPLAPVSADAAMGGPCAAPAPARPASTAASAPRRAWRWA